MKGANMEQPNTLADLKQLLFRAANYIVEQTEKNGAEPAELEALPKIAQAITAICAAEASIY